MTRSAQGNLNCIPDHFEMTQHGIPYVIQISLKFHLQTVLSEYNP